jgi:hypothetical protein
MTREKAEKFVNELVWLVQLHQQQDSASAVEMRDCRETLVSLLTDEPAHHGEEPYTVASPPAETGMWNPSL